MSLFTPFNVYADVISDSVVIDGHMRHFHYLKPVHSNKVKSLVFVLHGSGGTGQSMMNYTKELEARAATEGLLLVYPDGYNRFWNECRKNANTTPNLFNIREELFFNYMIDYFSKRFKASKSNVFAIGFSGGGHMAYKLALTMPKKIKAISAIVASLPDLSNMDCVVSNKPVPVMVINGTNDATNPYQGGEINLLPVKFGKVRSTESTVEYWVSLANCQQPPSLTVLPDIDTADGKRIERYTYLKNGKPFVEFLKVINGEHSYPGDIDVYVTSWEFFRLHLN
nr:dienelactone hydrolase family protein [Flavihumibacter rivuli]